MLDLGPRLLCGYLIISLCYSDALDMLPALPMYIGCKNEGVVLIPTCLYNPFFLNPCNPATHLHMYMRMSVCTFTRNSSIHTYSIVPVEKRHL